MLLEAEILELTDIVIPRVMAHWKQLAYCMKYDTGDVEGFDEVGKNTQECCKKLFINWLSTSHDPMPKTYQTLLEHIKKIDNLAAASKMIERELLEGKGK